jgi:hypothetical protein
MLFCDLVTKARSRGGGDGSGGADIAVVVDFFMAFLVSGKESKTDIGSKTARHRFDRLL